VQGGPDIRVSSRQEPNADDARLTKTLFQSSSHSAQPFGREIDGQGVLKHAAE